MDINSAAAAFRELGHPVRLGIYRELVRAGHDGLPVGSLQEKLAIPASTLSHHISALMSVDLIRQLRQGRVLYCQPQFARLEELMTFMVKECCSVPEGYSAPARTLCNTDTEKS